MALPRLFAYLIELMKGEYWGKGVLTFKRGKLVTVREVRQFREDTLPVKQP